VDTASVLSLSLDARGSADGAASDNDTVADETNGPPAKYRKLPCSEPPPPFPGRRAELAAALAARGAVYLPPGAAAVEDFARSVVAAEQADDLFYVYDLSVVDRLHGAWVRAMPRVEPFYAVKCNPDDGILAVLAALGAGFDCASEAEIAQVLAHGVSPDRIIYAHPCKPAKQLRWAAAAGVGLTTFDTESELRKVAAHHPGAALLLRIRADDPSARCQLGNKYGADAEDVPALLRLARDLGLGVRGVSFHVGSGAKSASAFWNAIAAARAVFDAGHALGFDMSVLDIGGGFCGGTASAGGAGDLGGVPAAVNAALAAFFPEDGNVRVIAEPGALLRRGLRHLCLRRQRVARAARRRPRRRPHHGLLHQRRAVRLHELPALRSRRPPAPRHALPAAAGGHRGRGRRAEQHPVWPHLRRDGHGGPRRAPAAPAQRRLGAVSALWRVWRRRSPAALLRLLPMRAVAD
jgi:hypothetical protein